MTANPDPGSRPASRPPSPGGRSVLAADIRLTGDLTSTGTVEILGEIVGDITAQSVVIGGEGHVQGTVRVDNLDVRGRLDGQAICGTFTLRSAAQVMADIVYDTVVIESGAQINGRFSLKKG